MTTIFPSVVLQQQVNSVSTRHIQPNGHGSFNFVWTHFGFKDDTDEMTQRRLRQANLFGPMGPALLPHQGGRATGVRADRLRAATIGP